MCSTRSSQRVQCLVNHHEGSGHTVSLHNLRRDTPNGGARTSACTTRKHSERNRVCPAFLPAHAPNLPVRATPSPAANPAFIPATPHLTSSMYFWQLSWKCTSPYRALSASTAGQCRRSSPTAPSTSPDSRQRRRPQRSDSALPPSSGDTPCPQPARPPPPFALLASMPASPFLRRVRARVVKECKAEANATSM